VTASTPDAGAPPTLAQGEAPKAPAWSSNAPALAPRKPATQSYRFVRAYATTFTVIGSYLLTYFLGRVFGARWLEARLETVHAKNARRVQSTIVALQGLFIKVGQLLSVLANFLPAPFRDGLAALQDRVPPRPTDEIKRRIQRDLGKPVSELFVRFNEEPIASASLGQVHEAYLADGRHVAVKVQHADIDDVVRLDLATIRRIMHIASAFLPAKNLDTYYRQIRAMIQEELDFEREAKNIERIMQNFVNDPLVVFPKPVAELSTKTVMTTTFVFGFKVNDLKRIDEAKIDRKALARKIVETFCHMIFVDGIYHADPHPGNMLVGEKGELVLLDFGAVAELSREMREGIPEFLEGVIRRDTERLIRALKKMGFISRADSEDVSERVVEFFHQRFQEDVKLESFNLKDIKLDPPARPREPDEPAPHEHRPEGAVAGVPRPAGLGLPRAHAAAADRGLHRARPGHEPGRDHPAVRAELRARQPGLGPDRARSGEGHGLEGGDPARRPAQVPAARQPGRGRDPGARPHARRQHRRPQRALARLRRAGDRGRVRGAPALPRGPRRAGAHGRGLRWRAARGLVAHHAAVAAPRVTAPGSGAALSV
jgi:predicted unusual protein kinase regulating ubiquinone biosynthesis (AarF/ABC1/UbiB family)